MAEKIVTPEYTQFEAKNRGLIYSQEFRQLLEQHPHLIDTVRHLIPQLKNPGESVSQDEVAVSFFLDTTTKQKKGFSHLYKLDVGEQSFLLKIEVQDEDSFGGYAEAASTARAMKFLQDVPGVEVARFYLGYSDKSGQNYFVSEWKNLPLLADVLKDPRVPIERLRLLKKRLEALDDLMSANGFIDTSTVNTFYDAARDMLVIVDITHSDYFYKYDREEDNNEDYE